MSFRNLDCSNDFINKNNYSKYLFGTSSFKSNY